MDNIGKNFSYNFPTGIYLLKVNNRNTGTGVVLVSLFLTLNFEFLTLVSLNSTDQKFGTRYQLISKLQKFLMLLKI